MSSWKFMCGGWLRALLARPPKGSSHTSPTHVPSINRILTLLPLPPEKCKPTNQPTFRFLHFPVFKERAIRWTAPDRYRDAVSSHVCYSLTPAMGKFTFDVILISWHQRKSNTNDFEYLLYRIGMTKNDSYWECDLLTFDIDTQRRRCMDKVSRRWNPMPCEIAFSCPFPQK